MTTFNPISSGSLYIMYNGDNKSVLGLEWISNDGSESYVIMHNDWIDLGVYTTAQEVLEYANLYRVEDEALKKSVVSTVTLTGNSRDNGDPYYLSDLVNL